MKNKKYRVTTDALKGYNKGETVVAVDCDGKGFPVIPIEHNGIDKNIVERNPNWFEPVGYIEAGQYWYEKKTEHVYRVMDESSYPSHDWRTKPINYQGCDYTHWCERKLKEQCRKLSTNEIKEALVKEAKRRGFEKGATVIPTNESISFTLSGKKNWGENKHRYYGDCLWMNVNESFNARIYDNGEWAEPIDQTPEELGELEAAIKSQALQELKQQIDEIEDNPFMTIITFKRKVLTLIEDMQDG